jgi:hypothetical protein
MSTFYRFQGRTYSNEQEAINAVMAIHPELLDDDMPDFINHNVDELTLQDLLDECALCLGNGGGECSRCDIDLAIWGKHLV